MKLIYLAGPDVFYPDARQRGEQMQALCAAHGFRGLYPLDAVVDSTAPNVSRAIYAANRRFIERADAVIANLRDFRGFEPDSGTVWEASYALALGKPVVGYLPAPASIVERMGAHACGGVDGEGLTVEDFGLPLNLMLAHSLTGIVHGPEEGFAGFIQALGALRQWFAQGHLARLGAGRQNPGVSAVSAPGSPGS